LGLRLELSSNIAVRTMDTCTSGIRTILKRKREIWEQMISA